MNWHLLEGNNVLQQTDSKPEGLSALQAESRLLEYGPNQLAEKRQKPAWLLFVLQFKDVMILILIAAGIVSGMVGELVDTLVILIIVVLNAVVGFFQEYRAERAMEALKSMTAPNATVLRDGAPSTVQAANLVPGDIVLLTSGNLVPADIRLLETHSLKIEEAALTGESLAVEKQTAALEGTQLLLGDHTNMAYKGTMVVYGRGNGVVVATGMRTEIGQIAELLQGEESDTPLQIRLADFSKKLSYAILAICIVIYVTGLLRGEEPVRMLLTAISVAVAAIPEALPAVVTIALALGARRMVRKNALIRKLPAVETLGSITYICTDKTGTITQNRMTVTQTWVPDTVHTVLPLPPEQALHLCMALNHNVQKDALGAATGESTEIGLANYVETKTLPAEYRNLPRIEELPFDPVRKMMTTVHSCGDGQYLVVTKGAVESIVAKLLESDHSVIGAAANQMAEGGMRVLAYAWKMIGQLPARADSDVLERDLQFCGLAGMIDPPRPEAAQAIADCRSAGIVPIMITGDHPVTAAAIAREVGIIDSPTDRIVTGSELSQMPQHEFEEKVERIKVYARVSPEQKLEIVKTLQRKNQFVAMTGDGVNDAPALRRANIGVAMGQTGTDVSKEAAHMILRDDNFATIVKSIREGRRIYENIRKFVKYILTGNSGEIWVIFLAPLAGMPIPLLPIHILWVNLVTDGLPALALAGEPAEKDIMQLPPRKPDESIFAHGLGWHVLWVGLLIGGVCLGTQAWAMQNGDPKWQTYVFTILCFSQLAHLMAIRSDHFFLFKQGLFSNLLLILAVAVAFLLQLAILYVPFLQEIFSTEPLSLDELGICVLAALVVFHAVEAEKMIRNKFLPIKR